MTAFVFALHAHADESSALPVREPAKLTKLAKPAKLFYPFHPWSPISGTKEHFPCSSFR